MDLSIIIVNYNNSELLQKCLETIAKSSPSMKFEIIVVDNNSDYDVAKQLNTHKRSLPNISLIQNRKNRGFGTANNQGVEKAKGDYLLFLNTDIEVLGSAIDNLYGFIVKQDFAIVGGKLINPDRSDQSSAGPFFNLWNTFVMLFLFGDRLGITRYSPNKIKKVGWVSGSCFIIKRDDFKLIGGFDESIFMYMEEVDLMYRGFQNGISVIFYPKAQFVHIGAATSSSRTLPVLNIYNGLLYFYEKHYSLRRQKVLRFLLATKARLSYILGKATGNAYLMCTYEQAFKIVQEK